MVTDQKGSATPKISHYPIGGSGQRKVDEKRFPHFVLR